MELSKDGHRSEMRYFRSQLSQVIHKLRICIVARCPLFISWSQRVIIKVAKLGLYVVAAWTDYSRRMMRAHPGLQIASGVNPTVRSRNAGVDCATISSVRLMKTTSDHCSDCLRQPSRGDTAVGHQCAQGKESQMQMFPTKSEILPFLRICFFDQLSITCNSLIQRSPAGVSKVD